MGARSVTISIPRPLLALDGPCKGPALSAYSDMNILSTAQAGFQRIAVAKPGYCPPLLDDDKEDTKREECPDNLLCLLDMDCPGALKCCFANCSYGDMNPGISCVQPVKMPKVKFDKAPKGPAF